MRIEVRQTASLGAFSSRAGRGGLTLAALLVLACFDLTGCSQKAPEIVPEPIQQAPGLSRSAIKFDTTGLTSVYTSGTVQKWSSGRTEEVSLHCILAPPDIPCALSDKKGVQNYFRNCARQSGGGLVSVDMVKVKEVPCIMTIVKVPQKPSGMTYIGSLTIPLAEGSYVIRVQCIETGITGSRESAVLQNLTTSGKVGIDAHGNLTNWQQDPYDPGLNAPDLILRNKADDERYDKLFPTHPLTKVRFGLRTILRTLELDKSVLLAPPFLGP
ncbi:MAG: hypothetical protein SFV17_28410 [Candidatus Obscuribacter sp.]|nr:hypothetical protein [Candidatus Obscuribacter sp.]